MVDQLKNWSTVLKWKNYPLTQVYAETHIDPNSLQFEIMLNNNKEIRHYPSRSSFNIICIETI